MSAAPPHTNKVVLITGGARGIGLATALILADRGWQPVVADLEPLSAADLPDGRSPASLTSLIVGRHRQPVRGRHGGGHAGPARPH